MSPVIKPVITREQIQTRLRELAAQINQDYAGQELILIGVLKGVFIFLADLIRFLDMPVRVDFVRLRSYGDSCHLLRPGGDHQRRGTFPQGSARPRRRGHHRQRPHFGISGQASSEAAAEKFERSAVSPISWSAGLLRFPSIMSALWWKKAFGGLRIGLCRRPPAIPGYLRTGNITNYHAIS